jgi:transposase-like protein
MEMRDGGYQKCGSLLEFSERFQTEEACRRHLFQRRWPNGFACPRCGGVEYYHISKRDPYECRYCRHQSSITAGTVMDKTRTPLRIWFFLIFLMANQRTGLSVLGASRMLGIPYDRAWRICHKIRAAMGQRDASYTLAGFVEMDESYFGARKSGKRGRGAEGKRPVMVGVNFDEHGPKHAFMKVIERIDADTIGKAAGEKIEAGSHVKTDGLPAYHAGLAGYHHEEIIIKDPKTASKKLPWVHILVANAKNTIRGAHHGVSPAYLQQYLSEFCWRFSRRWSGPELFDRLLYTCIVGSPSFA